MWLCIPRLTATSNPQSPWHGQGVLVLHRHRGTGNTMVWPLPIELQRGSHANLWLLRYLSGSELSSSTPSATALLPGQDNPAPSAPMSGASWFVVSCGFRLSEVGFEEIRKPQVVRIEPAERRSDEGPGHIDTVHRGVGRSRCDSESGR